MRTLRLGKSKKPGVLSVKAPLPSSPPPQQNLVRTGRSQLPNSTLGRHQKEALLKQGLKLASDTPSYNPNMSKCQLFLLCSHGSLQRAALAGHAQSATVLPVRNRSLQGLLSSNHKTRAEPIPPEVVVGL